MRKSTWGTVFSADVMEFIQTANQFCICVENAEGQSTSQLCHTLSKLLSTLYGNALRITEIPLTTDEDYEPRVTEDQYNAVRNGIARNLGSLDDYLDVFVEDMKYSDKPILKTISEDVADIYQQIGNFIIVYQEDTDEAKISAFYDLIENFKSYWGGRALSALRAIHEWLWSEDFENEEEYDE